jgi:hypothetical protein
MVKNMPVLNDYFTELLRARHPEALARAGSSLALP